jgi:hypothetical protein
MTTTITKPTINSNNTIDKHWHVVYSNDIIPSVKMDDKGYKYLGKYIFYWIKLSQKS